MSKSKPKLYEWLCSLPNPLFKFANRAKIVTGVELLRGIEATEKVVLDDVKYEERTLAALAELVSYHSKKLEDIKEELSDAQEAITQYYEVKERDGKVEP